MTSYGELIRRGAPLDAPDGKGRTAMMLAAGASAAGVDLPCGYDEVDALLLPRDAG